MTGIFHDDWKEQADDPEVRIDGRVDPAREDAHWQEVYWAEPYYRADFSYDDYAPAYCVGYIGYAQYGGCFEDAEKSLCANWLRIKGDSRLSIEEALQAIRAAWDHAGRVPQPVEEEEDEMLVDAALAAAHATPARQPAYAAA
ncbi:MAG TPA: hypothetical protein VFM98_11875 [Ramlibacter sp.]|uniref:hypothetical protein n=1 Tax=Ramlibacter sp. TaxID=1917967 RepID=UPI002D804483|nr:hypothetical protein [Ramlibacter sp.]HET8746296.1 hypothetical protein [Ramlibacter sp.]